MNGPTLTKIFLAPVLITAAWAIYAQANMQSANTPDFSPVAEVEDLMELNKELNGEIRKQFAGTPDFKEVAHNARLISEIGNVLQYHKSPDTTDWWKWAGMLRDRAKTMAETAVAKDAEGTRSAQRELFDTCKMCHDKYRDH